MIHYTYTLEVSLKVYLVIVIIDTSLEFNRLQISIECTFLYLCVLVIYPCRLGAFVIFTYLYQWKYIFRRCMGVIKFENTILLYIPR